MKIQKWTAEVFKLNDLKYNFITYAKQSILSDQNYGIAVFFVFFCGEFLLFCGKKL